MLYIIILFCGIDLYFKIHSNPTGQFGINLAVMVASLVWLILDRYRSKNRSESIIAGFVFFVCGAAALMNHHQNDHGFFFWAGMLGAVIGAVTYTYEVHKQIKQKRASEHGLLQ